MAAGVTDRLWGISQQRAQLRPGDRHCVVASPAALPRIWSQSRRTLSSLPVGDAGRGDDQGRMMDPVEQQYSQYSYPEPADDIPTWLQTWNYDPYDPSLFSPLYWPEGRPRANLEILVAGCGTMQAAVLAFKNPACRITGVDFSSASIAHEARLRERHDLKNLLLEKMDLRDLPKLGRSFDLIVSSGVLHHLADPQEGLRALAGVLEPLHGVMLIMLYGRFARTGVYALQDAFRRMRLSQSPEGIEVVRSTIQRLPPRHPARWYFDSSPEMNSDAAIVDTFLHSQDTAYSVADVLDFVRNNGLVFKGWLDAALYNQDVVGLAPDMADEDRWSIVEILTGLLPQHCFMASLPSRDPRSVISFASEHWLDYVPQRHPQLRPSNFEQFKIVRGKNEFIASPLEFVLVGEANGSQPISGILKHKALAKLAFAERKNRAKEFYRRMWRQGHMFFSVVPVNTGARPD